MKQPTTLALLLALFGAIQPNSSYSETKTLEEISKSVVLNKLYELAVEQRHNTDSSEEQWIIVDLLVTNSRYYFTNLKEDPAFPAMFKSELIYTDNVPSTRTTMVCEGDLATCQKHLAQLEKRRDWIGKFTGQSD